MKTSLVTSLIVLAFASAGFASPAETELKALQQQWLDAYVKGDAAFLKNIEAEDWMLIDPAGKITTKAQDVQAVSDKSFVMKTAALSDVQVRMLGENGACVSAIAKITGTSNGEDISGDYRVCDVFEKKAGKWVGAMSQVTRIAPEKK